MRVRLHRDAASELIDAIAYYDSCEPGLGLRFSAEVDRTIDYIADQPEAWPILDGDTRRCRTNHFPYGVIFQRQEDYILIVAITHLRRKPGYWKHRIQ